MPTRVISTTRLGKSRPERSGGHVAAALPVPSAEGTSDGPTGSSLEKATIARQEALTDFLSEITPLPRYRVAMLWLALLAGLVLSMKDVSIGASTARAIHSDLGDSAGEALWVAITPSLVYATLCLALAHLSNFVGRRNAALASFLLFTTCSAACGAATTFRALVALQSLQSVGGAGLYCMAMVVMPDVTPVSLIPFLPAAMGGTAVVGSLLGPVLGGWLVENGAWRWFYWINVPVATCATITFAAACPKRTRAERLEEQKLRDLDWQGSLLLIATCGFSLLGLQQAVLQASVWSALFHSTTCRIGLVCGVTLLARLYTTIEPQKHSTAHALPFHVITDPVLLAQVALSLLAGCSYTSLTVLLPMRFEVVNFRTASQVAVHIIPFGLAFAIGTATCGFLLKRRGLASFRLRLAWILMAVGNGLLVSLDGELMIDPSIYGYLALAGLGTGIACASCTFGATLYCRPQDTAIVQGFIAQARVLGAVIAMANFSAILNCRLVSHLHDQLSTEHIVQIQTTHDTLSSLDILQRLEVRNVFALASNEAMAYCAGSALLGIGVSLFISEQRFQDLQSKARQIERLLFSSFKSN